MVTYVDKLCEQRSIWRIQPPFMNQVYWCCTQREAEVDHEAVQTESDLFPRITTVEVMNEKQHKGKHPFSHRLQRGVATWEDMPTHVLKDAVRLREKARQH